MKCYVVGNNEAITPALLESLDAPAFGVNRIWRIFRETAWRPAYYVRAEVPAYNLDHVKEDLIEMGRVGCVMYLQAGFHGFAERFWNSKECHPATRFEFFETCGGSRHDWHLPKICAYGTVTNIAVQIAVTLGFDDIHVTGCGGDGHFYDEPFTNRALADDASEIARRCCPVELTYA